MLSSFLKRSGDAATAFMDNQPLVRDNQRIMNKYALGLAFLYLISVRTIWPSPVSQVYEAMMPNDRSPLAKRNMAENELYFSMLE